MVMVTTTEAYAGDHGDVLRKFSAAMAQMASTGMSPRLPPSWQDYANSVKVTEPGRGCPVSESCSARRLKLTKWDAATIKVQSEKFINQLIEIIRTEGFAEKVPEGLFTTAYDAPGK